MFPGGNARGILGQGNYSRLIVRGANYQEMIVLGEILWGGGGEVYNYPVDSCPREKYLDTASTIRF